MRQYRRVSFAAPFVMVVTAACGHAEKGHDNPPSPKLEQSQLTPEVCKQIQPGERCDTNGEHCETGESCGIHGFECTDGKWKEQMNLCNPPPPSDPAPNP